MRYLLFGASTTFGETDYEFGGWAGHMRKYLEEKEKHRYFYNLAVPGDTSRNLLKRIESESLARIKHYPKDEITIFICIGTNDSRIEKKEPLVPEDEYRENLKKIISIAKTLAGNVILIRGNPVLEDKCNPWKGKDIFFYNDGIKEYGNIMKNVAEEENISIITTFEEFENQDNREELYDDGLHPNAKGHKVLFDIIKRQLDYLNLYAP
ncbi:MAG: SGNH/GDSL hydrolase family protein [Candidatus Woesearchaeota archaeon]